MSVAPPGLASSSSLLCGVIHEVSGHAFRNHKELLEQRFDFLCHNGWMNSGTVRWIEFRPQELMRFWGDGESHVEWLWDNGALRSGYPHFHARSIIGQPGTFHLEVRTHVFR